MKKDKAIKVLLSLPPEALKILDKMAKEKMLTRSGMILNLILGAVPVDGQYEISRQ